jgi:fibro-slime domain-containing protein
VIGERLCSIARKALKHSDASPATLFDRVQCVEAWRAIVAALDGTALVSEPRMRNAIAVCLVVGCGPSNQTPDAAVAPPVRDGPAQHADADVPQSCGELTAIVRDFKADHPDFESHSTTDDRGIVEATLGSDGKPIYAHAGATPSVAGPASFAAWFHDTPGTNLSFMVPLPLVEGPPGTFTFDDQTFFPIDGLGWPNQEVLGHNFLFTTEIHATFVYRGGEKFRFEGDDDVFVFINGKLAIDLGGVHEKQGADIDFDASAATLGLVKDQVHTLDVFHAERHTIESHFRMVTTIDCLIIL